MKKQNYIERFKGFISSLGWKLFIWGLGITQEEYWERIYQQEKEIEHTCKYCGCLTTQSDDDCYANPKNTMETPKEKAQSLFAKYNDYKTK